MRVATSFNMEKVKSPIELACVMDRVPKQVQNFRDVLKMRTFELAHLFAQNFAG